MEHANPLPDYLVDHYINWRKNQYRNDKNLYLRLVTEGQHPQAMVISCCDSRVEAHALFSSEPGALFTLRNIANLVPPYALAEHSVAAALEYAVNSLKVAHIIVLGHAHCGGVKAYHAMREDTSANEHNTAFISSWLQTLKPAYERIDNTISTKDSLQKLEQESILVSLENLTTFPFIYHALVAKTLTLHGAWFDIGQGSLHHYSAEEGKFRPI